MSLVSQVAQGTPWPAGTEPILHRNSLSWGYRYQDDRWPSVEAMMLDIDGDGLLDRVTNASTPAADGQCRMAWKRNLGPPAGGSSRPQFSGVEQYVALPRLKWNGIGSSSPTLPSAGAGTADPATPHFEGCALNRQVTAYRNSYSVTGICHDGATCSASGDPGHPGPYCYPGGTECTPGSGGGPTPGEYRTYLFGFDLRHQLTSVASTTAGYFHAGYSYGTGGRFARATHAQTISPLPPGTEVKPRDVNYVYGGIDPEQVTALTNVSGGATYASYIYDTAGNQLTRTYPPIGESWDYVYDGSDQLRRATKKVNHAVQGSEEYWYDGEGQRIAVLKRDASGAKTELIYFLGDVQAHHDASGTLNRVYSHLSMGTPVARIDRTGNTSSAVEYQFHGLAGSTIAAVAQDGTINAGFSYAPFGEIIEATNAGGAASGITTHKRRLNDKYEDDLTTLTYYGARYYDKTAISWTQADPLFIRVPDLAKQSTPRRANTYTFSLQNPLRFVDPDGRNPRQGDGMCSPSPTGRGCSMEDATPPFVADIKQATERLSQAADFTLGAAEKITPTEDQSRFGLAIFAAFIGQPELAFVILMSGAQNHNDTVMPIMAYGMGGGGAGRRIASDSGGVTSASGVGAGTAPVLQHPAGVAGGALASYA